MASDKQLGYGEILADLEAKRAAITTAIRHRPPPLFTLACVRGCARGSHASFAASSPHLAGGVG